MNKSPKMPLVIGGVSTFLAACCWLLQLPPADSSRWSEKHWSVYQVNHVAEGFCMLGFALLAILFFGAALFRWFKCRKQKE